MKLVKFGMVGGLMLVAATAMALPGMMKVFNDTYKPGKDSKLKKAECAICHVDKKKTKLNPYGESLKKALGGSKTLTADILKKVEGEDSDKDGVKNIDEIKGGSLPGDPKSKPESKN